MNPTLNNKIENHNSFNITLPNYIIKYLLKLICVHINDKNKNRELYEFHKINNDAKEKEKQLKVKLSLVCWEWFKCISRNLNVSIDFKYFNQDIEKNKFTILKNKYIQVLKLVQYDNLDVNYEEGLKMKISQFKNLKKIIICRRYILKDLVHYPQTFNFEFFNRVLNGINSYSPIKINFHFALYCNCFGFLEVPLRKCTFKVNKIQIDSCCEESNVIFNYFEYFNPRKLVIVPKNVECHYERAHLNLLHLDKWMFLKNLSTNRSRVSSNNVNNQNELFQHQSFTNVPITQINFLENAIIQSLEIKDSFTIRELFYIIYYIPQIKYLSIGICINELIEQFMKYNEYEIKSIKNNENQENGLNNNELDFKFYWGLFRNRLITNKNLINLVLNNKCSNKCSCFIKNQQSNNNGKNQIINKNQTPIRLIHLISEIFENNSSIKMLKLINFNDELNEYIIHNSKINKKINIVIQK